MLNNGINFLDIPYVAHTLEVTDGEEELIINCDEVDCTTFVEYTLAMALSPTEDGQVAEGDFATNLQRSATVMENQRLSFTPALHCRLGKQWYP